MCPKVPAEPFQPNPLDLFKECSSSEPESFSEWHSTSEFQSRCQKAGRKVKLFRRQSHSVAGINKSQAICLLFAGENK